MIGKRAALIVALSVLIAFLSAPAACTPHHHDGDDDATPPEDDDLTPDDDDNDDDFSPVDDDATPVDDDDNDDNDDDDNDDDDFVWTPMSGDFPPLQGVWGSSHSDVFAVGILDSQDEILHYDGKSWAAMDPGGAGAGLSAVWGTSSSDVFAVGFFGEILHYNGSAWSAMNSPTGPLYGVWGASATDVIAVGGVAGGAEASGWAAHYDGAAWSVMPGSGIWFPWLLTVFGFSGADIYAAGAVEGSFVSNVMHYNGKNWSYLPSLPPDDEIFGLWGTSESDLFAGAWLGNGGVIEHFDGASWSEMFSASCTVNAMWGTAHDDVFALGDATDFGQVLHYDGMAWSIMAGSNVSADLHGIWGSSPGDVFVVGFPRSGPGVILHYGPPQ